LRIPDNNIACAIIRELGRPILSASLPGELIEDYTDPEIMYENFRNEVDLVIDGGIGGSMPSTIIDCTKDVCEVTRMGAGEWFE
jgi:tRNA A37 threonylcarbamoyladenosine synthetase subunit TsaC/SUA5/YrdC